MNKKALAISTLIGLILAVTAGVTFIAFVAKYVKLTPASINSYYDLIESIQELSDSQYPEHTKNKIINMDKKSAIVFFEQGKKLIFGTSSSQTFRTIFKEKSVRIAGADTISINEVIEPDHPECKGQNCICLCNKLSYEITNIIGIANPVVYAQINCQPQICNKLDVKAAPNLGARFYSNPEGRGYIWFYSGGFILARNLKTISEINPDIRKFEIWLQKYKDFIGVCKRKPSKIEEVSGCISGNTKKILDFAEEFQEQFEDCQLEDIPEGNNSCICGEIDISNLPENYKLRFQGFSISKIKTLVPEDKLPEKYFQLYEYIPEIAMPLYNIDDDQQEILKEEYLDLSLNSKDNTNIVFKQAAKSYLILTRFKKGEKERIAIAKHTFEIPEDEWKITGIEGIAAVRNFVRVTRDPKYVKTIPLCS